MLEAGIRESGFCASTMPVCEAGNWAKPKSDPKRMLVYFGTFFCLMENILLQELLIEYSCDKKRYK